MKKTYISPSFMMVRLNPSRAILTVSNPDVTLNGDEEIGTLDAKAYNPISDKNVWDSEW
ncbi:MAG: hypothetical protein IKQ37_04390 [Bacteroidaceae bacterium]|nr:hypothetical protein [Bacteroidaceae bacterium]